MAAACGCTSPREPARSCCHGDPPGACNAASAATLRRVSRGSRRRPPSRPRSRYGPSGPGGYDYAYEEGQPGYDQPYPFDPRDDWWEEGTGGMFSPLRVVLGVLVIGSGLAALWAMFIADTDQQLPITIGSLAVLGVSLGLLALSSASGAASLGRRGYGGRALLAALFGGLCAMGSAGSLAGAIALGMIWLSA